MNPFGLISFLANSRITLPLVHIETRFRITGEFAAVEMEQVFEQTAREPLDVTYTFPLPGGAAVYRCEMQVNGRLIRACVMEEQEARRTVTEKKAAGHRTALVEMDRENLFTLQLGNAAPGDQIVIRFAYFEKLDRLGAGLSLRIPFCPGVRYIPGKPLLRKNRGLGSLDDTDQVPDASRLSPPRISATHPDAATLYLHGTLDADEVSLTTLNSITHPAVIRPADALLEVELAGEQHVPDRDFVLRWEETATTRAKSKAWVCQHSDATSATDHRYALLQLRAPTAESTTVVSDDYSQDIYFLLDRSGSMEGQNWAQAALALHAFVRQLGARDRVWLTCFESSFQDFSDAPMLRDVLLADTGFQKLASLGTGGGTELLPALRHVLKKRSQYSKNQPARVILITDGQVGNENEIVRLMREPEQEGLPIHCFGIDRAVNDAFLKNLARITGGRCTLMTPDDDIPAAVEKLAHTLRRPVLTGLKLQGGHMTTRETDQLPDLCAGDVLITPIRLQAESSGEVQITGYLPDGRAHTVSYDVSAPLPDAEAPLPRLLWAHRRTRYLLETERQAEGIQLAIAHNLSCRGASFVAWDEAEKVSVAKREVYQPSQGLDCSRSEASMAQRSPLFAAPKRMFPMIPAGAALNMMMEQNFFETKVTDYQKASALHDCGDDDLLAEAPADDGIRYSLASAPNLKGDHETTGPVLPRPVRLLHDRFMRHYNVLFTDQSKQDTPLMQWVRSFEALLVSRAAIQEPSANLIALILRHWAMQIIGTQRHHQLERLLIDLKSTPEFLPTLRLFLSQAAPSQAITDATQLLETALANPVREKRSWFKKKA
jgi:Ca-activated chloride channel homolog